MTRKLVRLVLVTGLVTAGALGAHQLMAKPPGSGGCPTGRPNCVCPQYVDPVVCPDGCTYYNGCAASCAGETGCTRTGGGPVQ